jgi:hypothetical protein
VSDPAGTRQHAGPAAVDWAKARDSFNRLVQAAFGTGRARFCIPVEESDDTVDAALMAGEQVAARLASLEAERAAVAPLVAAVGIWHQARVAYRVAGQVWADAGSLRENDSTHDAYIRAQYTLETFEQELADAYAARAGQGGEGA